MVSDSIELRIKQIIADKLEKDLAEINDDCNLVNDLGADSLDTIELTMLFEEMFDISFNDDDLAKAQTVAEVISLIKSKI